MMSDSANLNGTLTTQQQPPRPEYRIERRNDGRAWAVWDPAGVLVCLCLYRRGAREVVRRLAASN